MQNFIIKDNMEKYLSSSKYINWTEPSMINKAKEFQKQASDEITLICIIYEYVRDEIKHSWDAKDRRITKTAAEVLENKTGICWAKSNLLAALLRACNIPAGICYQRLTFGNSADTKFCIHALNAVYIRELGRWIRLDARGNKEGVDAQFCLQEEKLAFPVRREMGEADYKIIYANPANILMKILEENEDALYMYQHALPDSIYEYKRADFHDIEELVRTRMIVLRAANKLPDNTDMEQLRQASCNYYNWALQSGGHIAYLAYDGSEFIGAGGVSFYQIMPTYHNPSGKKARIMNMYTAPEYRGQGIAYKMLDLLVKEVKKQGVSKITLEATEMGRPLYEKYGFVPMNHEMELI